MGGGSSKRAQRVEALHPAAPPPFNPGAVAEEQEQEQLQLEPEPEPQPELQPELLEPQRRGSWLLAPVFDLKLSEAPARAAAAPRAACGFEYSFALERSVLNRAAALGPGGPVATPQLSLSPSLPLSLSLWVCVCVCVCVCV